MEEKLQQQRIQDGYHDEDLWNFDHHLARMIVDALPRIPSGDEEWKRKRNNVARVMNNYAEDFWYPHEADQEWEQMWKDLQEIFMGLWC